MNEDLQRLINKLTDASKSCEDRFVDLRMMTFKSVDGEMFLTNDKNTYYFKRDPENPRDPKIVYAAQQFCKLVGVPFSFIAKNSENMREMIVNKWIAGLNGEKSTVIMRVRSGPKGEVIRAILPVEFTNINNLDLLGRIGESAGDNFRVEFAIGDDRDDLILLVRFISNDKFDACGESCSLGFSVVMSELGASPLVVDTLLFRNESKSSFIASYGGCDPYFENEYQTIQKDDLLGFFPKMIEHIKEDLPGIKESIQSAKELHEKEEDILDLLKNLKLRKGLSDKFHKLLYQEVNGDGSVRTLWDFSNKVAILGKEFEIKARMKVERAAGDLIGLNFQKV